MATALSFRVATPADAAVIAKFVKASYRGESSRAGWTTEADLVADDRIDADGVVGKIKTAGCSILLAHDAEGKLAACCEVAKRDDTLAYFGLFAVDPLRQAGGIGRQVLAEAERYCRDEFAVARLEMWVIWTRDELIAWYLRRGYIMSDQTVPFPYAHLINGKALRDDLYFKVLFKDL